MPTIFTMIINGDIPGTFVWKDDKCVAFMSINPLHDGHILVVPREEIDHWIDCPDDLRDHLFEVSQTVSKALDAVYEPLRVALMIVGEEVPHLHIHLVPIDGIHDLNFSNAATAVDRDDLEEAAASVRTALIQLGATGVSD